MLDSELKHEAKKARDLEALKGILQPVSNSLAFYLCPLRSQGGI